MALITKIRLCNKVTSLQQCCTPGNPIFTQHLLLPFNRAMIKVPCATRVTFYQMDRKSGYDKNVGKYSKLKMAWEGLKHLKPETKLFFNEWKVKFENDPYLIREHLDHSYLWRFNSKNDTDQWVVTCDNDHREGNSTATFEINKNGNGFFHGNLSTKIPKDGIVRNAGYVNIRSPRNMIPISRFYRAFKGRIQDRQDPLPLDRIAAFGITLGDGNSGPFGLEIDYIAAMYDMNHTEEFAWEMYQTEPYTTNT
uniref:NADH:ubiquinone oxidoreductase intermediate-associated protein 30 domain-containing protein n=1 Tax=Octopus bimaculoides TaxID=37653 RepID=A0A0L8FTS4_OCTBM